MRRLMSIAAFALLLALPLWAQRGGHGGGGHAGGGMHAGGFSGHAGGGHSFGGMHSGIRSGPGFSRGFNRGPNRGFNSFHRGFGPSSFRGRGFRGHHHRDFDDFRFRNNWVWNNWGWGSPWWGYYDPLWWSWEEQDRRFDEDYYRQYEIANQMNQQSLEQQRMWRQEEADGDQDVYAPQSSSRHSAPGNVNEDADPVPATVLVFRDQHRQEVQNYAIVGQTLWAFSSGRTQKIPLAGLDVAATEQANDDRGVSFRIPGADQGQ